MSLKWKACSFPCLKERHIRDSSMFEGMFKLNNESLKGNCINCLPIVALDVVCLLLSALFKYSNDGLN